MYIYLVQKGGGGRKEKGKTGSGVLSKLIGKDTRLFLMVYVTLEYTLMEDSR